MFHFLRVLCGAFAVVAVGAAVSATAANALILASTADDVCGPAVDPCVVTDTVEIEDGSTLDFGVRGLEVAPGGQLDFVDGTSSVLCGRFLATTGANPAINLRSSGGDGANATLEARRGCSLDASTPCFEDADCSLLALGTCSAGDGTISLGGKVTGNAELSASFVIKAAGDVSTTERIEMDGTTADSSGGDLDITSTLGSVSLAADVNAKGGAFDSGGTVVLSSTLDVVVSGNIDVRGGEFDGGTFDANSQRDVLLTGDILADSTGGAGYGGAISIFASNEIRAVGGSAGNRILLRANGATSGEDFGGDGGNVFLVATTATFGEFARIQLNGAAPDGSGGSFELFADTITFDGEAVVTGPGGGGGGDVDLSGTTVTVGPNAKIDVDGGEFGGGTVTLFADEDLTMNGRIDAAGNSTARPGESDLTAGRTMQIGGVILVDGDGTSSIAAIRLGACTLVLAAGASVENRSEGGDAGRNELRGTGFLTIEAGATLKADLTIGENRLTYGNAAFPPVIAGTVSPAATIVLDEMLPGCPACDVQADCDDSNPCTDDSCDVDLGCMNVPNTDPCDDGNSCTTSDVCQSGQCIGDIPAECNDGNPCTDDSCEPSGGCINTPNNDPCDDGSLCSTDDTCVGGACIGVPPPACDDGNPCTRDACDDVAGCIAFEEPAPVCFVPGKSQVLVLDKDGGASDTIKWKWSKGESFAVAAIGTPDTDTDVTICVYDNDAGTTPLALRLDIPAGPVWSRAGSKGWKYKEKAGSADGVQKIGIKSGVDGKTSAQLLARGANLALPTPVGSTFFAADPGVTVQMVTSNGSCWSSSFVDPARNLPNLYKAK